MATLKLQNKFIRVDTIGYDAIACIVPKSMNIDSLSVDDLKNIFLGNDGRKIETVYLNGAGTSVIAYLETWCGKPNSKKHLYAMGNDAQIIEKISQSNQAMAFVSSKSFSNLASKQTLSNYNKVRLLPIYQKEGIAYFPDQSNLYEGLYPLKRTLYALLYDRVDGLGTAFVNFMLSERGQRLILKEGLLPHHMPSRKVSLE
jgi:phosphate transport system substrate-binding protein